MSGDRPTPTQAFRELAMAVATRQPSAAESSVAISRNARGIAQFEVVVRGEDAYACCSLATEIFESLAGAYPYPVVNGGTE